MNMKKWIFSSLLLLAADAALAGTTKVGNGDDGADLEGGKPITSGIIFETRALAAERLKKLNVQGIPGMGFVIPEIENTQLILAEKDVRPLSSEGDWETTEDGDQTYARTFAEPHAPTRFFPVALKLGREQLIALHTHEALHRALPPGIREDEEKVALLTLALTSHSATFDRINRVAQNVLAEPQPATQSPRTWMAQTLTAETPAAPLPPSRKSEFRIGHTGSSSSYAGERSIEKIGVEFSPIGTKRAFGYVTDPRFSADLLVLSGYEGYYAGPLSFSLKFPTELETGKTIVPFVRASLRSLEGDSYNSTYYSYDDFDYTYKTLDNDRDVYALGAVMELDRPGSYTDYGLTYTLPDHFDSDKGHGAIWSFDMRVGGKFRRLDLGGTAGLYHKLGKGDSKPFSIITTGPEIRYVGSRVVVRLAGTIVMNRRNYRDLEELGDMAGHGTGDSQVSLGLTFLQ